MAEYTRVEYRVREIKRYMVTRFHERDDSAAGCETKGEYDNVEVAYEVAYALCAAEHASRGWDLSDKRISYPSRIGDSECVKPAA